MAKSTLPLVRTTFDFLRGSKGDDGIPDLLSISPTSILGGFSGPGVLQGPPKVV